MPIGIDTAAILQAMDRGEIEHGLHDFAPQAELSWQFG
jgi:hypothetical protein